MRTGTTLALKEKVWLSPVVPMVRPSNWIRPKLATGSPGPNLKVRASSSQVSSSPKFLCNLASSSLPTTLLAQPVSINKAHS